VGNQVFASTGSRNVPAVFVAKVHFHVNRPGNLIIDESLKSRTTILPEQSCKLFYGFQVLRCTVWSGVQKIAITVSLSALHYQRQKPAGLSGPALNRNL
jgi:hypothetical protein